MWHVARHTRHHPPKRRAATYHRISKKPAEPRALIELIGAMGISVRLLLREKGHTLCATWPGRSEVDDKLIDFMMAHPILINRPIVVTEKGVRLCRPSEAALGLLPNPNIGRFIKELIG